VTGEDARARRRAGWLAALVVFAIYGGVAFSVDFSDAAVDFQSDEATYYLMGHSLAADGDLEYRQEDLQRGFQDFTRGPNGVFLKRGVDVTSIGLGSRLPFVEFRGVPDPDPSRLYYGKAFVYPLFAAPFVWLFGTNGFLVLNALLLTMAFLAAYTFLSVKSGTATGLLAAGAFVFATVVPVYFVWIAPELFNFSVGLVACFLWLYKHVAVEPPGRWSAWLRRPATDAIAAAIVGLLTFSKVTNVLLLPPMVGWLLWRREWRRAAAAIGAWGIVTALLFGANVAVSGEWNYQGGIDRRTCYEKFPLQQAGVGLDVCAERFRNEGLGSVIFDPEVFWSNLRANLVYVVAGRNSGLVAYYFPAVFGVLALFLARGRRQSWQWFVLAGVLVQIAVLIISLPYTYFGGGGSVGNRYFMGVYGACLFLLPPLASARPAVLMWLVGALFTAKLVLNPFYTSHRPGEHSKSGPLRLLPVELTNVRDLPINTDASRIRLWYGDIDPPRDIGFQIYYLDDNAYLMERDKSLWIRGDSRTELLINATRVPPDFKPLRTLQLALSSGPVATSVTVSLEGESVSVDLPPHTTKHITFALGPGFPYKHDRPAERPEPSYVWVLSLTAGRGFTPTLHEPGSQDSRYLGVRVRPMIVP